MKRTSLSLMVYERKALDHLTQQYHVGRDRIVHRSVNKLASYIKLNNKLPIPLDRLDPSHYHRYPSTALEDAAKKDPQFIPKLHNIKTKIFGNAIPINLTETTQQEVDLIRVKLRLKSTSAVLALSIMLLDYLATETDLNLSFETINTPVEIKTVQVKFEETDYEALMMMAKKYNMTVPSLLALLGSNISEFEKQIMSHMS